MKRVVFLKNDLNGVPIPEVGYKTIGIDTDGVVKTIDDQGNIEPIGGGGAAGGKVAIYDTNGVPTFYDTMTLALAEFTTGDVIQLMTNITENVTLNMPSNCSINGNGYTITNTANDATNILVKPNASTGIFRIKNLRLVKTTGTGSAFVVNDIGASQFETENFTTYSPSGYGGYIGSGCSFFDGNGSTFFESLNFYGAYSYSANVRGVRGKTGAYIGFRVGGSGGDLYNCIGESLSLAGFSNEGSGIAYNCIGISVIGKGLGYTSDTFGVYVDCIGISGSGVAMSYGNYTGGYGKSSISHGSQGSVCTNVVLFGGGSGHGAISCSLDGCFISNTSIHCVETSDGAKTTNNTITCNYSNAAGHGISGAFTNCIISNNFIQVSNTGANGVNVTSAYITNNTIKGATLAINAGTTQLAAAQDANGNSTI